MGKSWTKVIYKKSVLICTFVAYFSDCERIQLILWNAKTDMYNPLSHHADSLDSSVFGWTKMSMNALITGSCHAHHQATQVQYKHFWIVTYERPDWRGFVKTCHKVLQPLCLLIHQDKRFLSSFSCASSHPSTLKYNRATIIFTLSFIFFANQTILSTTASGL